MDQTAKKRKITGFVPQRGMKNGNAGLNYAAEVLYKA